VTRRALPEDHVDIVIVLLDDAFLSWSIASCECRDALQAWFDAPWGQRAAASRAYFAALDREEAAARELQRLSALPPFE
jgi:hypothetical protein